jgi:hypothetical protein
MKDFVPVNHADIPISLSAPLEFIPFSRLILLMVCFTISGGSSSIPESRQSSLSAQFSFADWTFNPIQFLPDHSLPLLWASIDSASPVALRCLPHRNWSCLHPLVATGRYATDLSKMRHN